MSRVYEKQTRTISENVPVGFKCDCCGIESTKRFEQVSMHHSSWGNDSGESYENKDYCSLECYRKLSIQFLDEFEYYCDTAVFDEMEYEKIKILIGENR